MVAMVLDATALLAPGGAPDIRAMVCGLASAGVPLVALGAHGFASLPHMATGPCGPQADAAAVRAWLLGEERPAAAGAPPPRASLRLWDRLARPPALAPDATLLKPGLDGWDDVRLQAALERNPAIRAVALLSEPVDAARPDAAEAGTAALQRRLAAIARCAATIVVADEATRAHLAAHLAAAGRSIPVQVVPPPSGLAGSSAAAVDAALAAVPYVVAPDIITARANTLLLLQIWRDLAGRVAPVPKLVLAGERGREIEEIRPLLDWNPSLQAHIVEAPGLPSQDLRGLLGHARAVVAPGFTSLPVALLRDARTLGLDVVAAAATGLPPGCTVLDPIDGTGWRAALLAALGGPARPSSDLALPGWDDYREAVAAC